MSLPGGLAHLDMSGTQFDNSFVAGLLPSVPISTPQYQACHTCIDAGPVHSLHAGCYSGKRWLKSRGYAQHSSCACRAASDDVASVLRDAMKGGREGTVDEAYRSGGAYLRTLGLESLPEITRILDVAMNPNSLYNTYRDKKRSYNVNARKLSVDADLKPVVEFLQSQGLSKSEVIRVISEHPPVLSYSVQERLQPFCEYLSSIGIPSPGQMLVKRPSLLGLKVEDSLQRMVGYLQANDYSLEQIIKFLETTL
ncbi:hypothetical protein WJX72_012502 [[Myrmecia] bisecta]|uniref:Uncharacterized protein n=1 Tax=[Myrmecia] bisecta TaxID=41462 RepID=A0AAW1PSY2_9CHLO